MTTRPSKAPKASLDAWKLEEAGFAERAAHDLRNPLAAIKLNVATLEATLKRDVREAKEIIAEIQNSVISLEWVIDNHETRGRLEGPDPHPAVRRAVSLRESVATAVVRLQSTAKASGVTLTANLDQHDPMIEADPRQVDLLVENLARNAITHARGRRVVVMSVTARDDRAEITVEDTGGPFGPVERDFSREGQAALWSSPDGRYSRGLGLYVVGAIARETGAEISVTTRSGRAVVTLLFPRMP